MRTPEDESMIATIDKHINQTQDEILYTLQLEGFISEYNMSERWYKSIKPEQEIRARWQEIIDESVHRITSIEASEWRNISRMR